MSWEAALSGCSLAMDAFAVSICAGVSPLRSPWGVALRLGGACGLFQFFMPLLGWFLGERFARWSSVLAPWLAFVLLLLVGGEMALSALRGEDRAADDIAASWRLLFSLALATSIDALVVGASFALAGLPVLGLASIAGVATALACALGVGAGHWLRQRVQERERAGIGGRVGRRIEFLGGVLLVLIGARILAAHLLHG